VDQDLSMFTSQAKLEELLELLRDSRSLLILTHDNPDPDALSAASCLKYIVSKKLETKVRIGYGGIVGRPENRRMLRFLKIHTARVSEAKIKQYKSVVLLDTQPFTGNNSLPRGMQVKGVIDHHPERKSTRAPFLDIRPSYGAAATILTEYLFASGLDVPTNLATALFYGIASETQDLGREVSEADTKAYLSLFSKANKRVLSKIRRPVVDRSYFANIATAIANAVTYKHTIATSLGRIENPDMVAQIAEMLLTLERMTWSIVTGRYKDTILFSIRTTRVKGRAGRVARMIAGSGGTAGGHDMFAGGQMDGEGKSEKQRDDVERRIVESFFRIRGKPEGGELTPLVPSARDDRRAEDNPGQPNGHGSNLS
jgi:nanoRNase/pAp phosphatase (c-di-AMP/oligoRNAs hydrolase)